MENETLFDESFAEKSPYSASYHVLIQEFNTKRQELHAIALSLAQPLSKAVLAYGAEYNDQRSILAMCFKDPVGHAYATTKAFRNHVALVHKMSVEAQCQVQKINAAMYPYPEIISMMLEQMDYWDQDAPAIVDWALAYINGDLT